MDFNIAIGKVHPQFFERSPIFAGCSTDIKGGIVYVQSPFFSMSYDQSTGELMSDDIEVLQDFTSLIDEAYGCKYTREAYKAKIDWSTVRDNWSTLSVGVCLLDNDISGWDGSPNALWYDNDNPAPIVTTYFQFWSTKHLHDADTPIQQNGLCPQVILPNLVDALLICDSSPKADRIRKNITELTKWI